MYATVRVLDEYDREVVLDVEFSMSYDPGCTSGPAEGCYPAEGEIDIEDIMVEKINGIEVKGRYDNLKEWLQENRWEEIDSQLFESGIDQRMNDSGDYD